MEELENHMVMEDPKRRGLKQYRVKERYCETRWLYVFAESKDEAISKLEDGQNAEYDVVSEEYLGTDWDTLEELTPLF